MTARKDKILYLKCLKVTLVDMLMWGSVTVFFLVWINVKIISWYFILFFFVFLFFFSNEYVSELFACKARLKELLEQATRFYSDSFLELETRKVWAYNVALYCLKFCCKWPLTEKKKRRFQSLTRKRITCPSYCNIYFL